MSARINPFLIGSIVLTILLYVILTQEFIGMGVALGCLVLALFVRNQKLDAIGQLILGLFCAVGAYVSAITFGVAGESIPPGRIGPVATTLALWFLFVSITRLLLDKPKGGIAASMGFMFLSVLSMGSISNGMVYPLGSLFVLALLLLAGRAGDPGRPTLKALLSRGRRTTVAVLLIAIPISLAFMIGLPIMYRHGVKRMAERYLNSYVAFGQTMRLGSMRNVLQLDEVVLRIRGKKPDYLRGKVYSRYVSGVWLGGRSVKERIVRFTKPAADTGSHTNVSSVGGDRDRYFVPINARALWVTGDEGLVDYGGVLLPPDGREAKTASFDISNVSLGEPYDPSLHAFLLAVPEPLKRELTEMAYRLSQGAASQAERLRFIEKQLKQGYQYSLEFDRNERGDPLMDFLLRNKRGHCEYFASAMTLLSRASGIPTRMVAGYRVYEWNPLGKYYVVRERNAHAWVEAWVDGKGWLTFDPTPASELLTTTRDQTPLISALLDVASESLRLMWRRVTGMTVEEMILVVGLLLAVWIVIILVRRLRVGKSKVATKRHAYLGGLTAMSRLISALEGMGYVRHPGEPVDVFARRVASQGDLAEWGASLNLLLNNYNRWRFGGKGDPDTLSREIERWLDKRG